MAEPPSPDQGRPDPRRPGPRTDLHARDVILDAAERLFAAAAPEAVSLRAVAREAGVAPGAVGYHFSHKAGLLEAVFNRHADRVAADITERLESLAEAEEPTHRGLVEAILLPYVGLVEDLPGSGLRWLKVYVRSVLTQDRLWLAELDRHPDVLTHFLAVAGRLMPNVSDLEVQRRMGIAMYTMLAVLATADLPAYGDAAGPRGLDPRFVEQLVVFTSAGLRG